MKKKKGITKYTFCQKISVEKVKNKVFTCLMGCSYKPWGYIMQANLHVGYTGSTLWFLIKSEC